MFWNLRDVMHCGSSYSLDGLYLLLFSNTSFFLLFRFLETTGCLDVGCDGMECINQNYFSSSFFASLKLKCVI